MNAVAIRDTVGPADREIALAIHRAAFGGPAEADLTAALLDAPEAAPCLSLLAERAGEPVGHILFSTARVEGASDVRAALLCPMAVKPEAQRMGIGTTLIEAGCTRLAADGAAFVFVLGDPAYYGRAGFEPAAPRGLPPPYPLPREHEDAWQVRALAPAVRAAGTVRVPAPLRDPALWGP